MSEEYNLFTEIGNSLNGAVQSQLFGKPCFKFKGKAFVCFFENEMVFKLSGEMHDLALGLVGSRLFDPSGKGRPMKQWVQIPYEFSDQWLNFAISAKGEVND